MRNQPNKAPAEAAAALLARAALYRRAASIPIAGGYRIDVIYLGLAERLEREAATKLAQQDQQSTP
jgi:hypothetical protein